MELGSTIKFALFGNTIALAIIFAIESSTSFFGIKYASDYAFFVLMLLWGSAALLYMYPPGSSGGLTSETGSTLETPVETEEALDVDEKRFDANTITCLKLLVSGAPALLFCIVNHFIN